jgi:hypothetical protein
MSDFLEELGNSIKSGVEQVLPDIENQVRDRLRAQINGPTTTTAPQPEATLTLAQAQSAIKPGSPGFYILLAAAAVGVYLILRKKGK